MTTNSWGKCEQLLNEWVQRAKLARTAHRMAGKRFAKLQVRVGGSLLVLSAVLGTTLFLKLDGNPIVRLIVLALSVSVFAVSWLQMFLRFHEKAERHESCRTGFASLCRQIEVTLALGPEDRGLPNEVLERIRIRYDELSSRHVAVPERLWKCAETEVKEKSKEDAQPADVPEHQ